MTKWQSGDIITDKRWNKLNNVYPLYKEIEIATDSPNNNPDIGTVIFDIQMSELQDLRDHGVICWCKDGNNNIVRINDYKMRVWDIDDARAAIIVMD